MYVTRPLSLYNNNPSASSAAMPEGPGSGVLVIVDEEAAAQATCCWGLCEDNQIYKLPFPQNKKLKIRYTTGSGEHQDTYRDYAFFIPVIDQPLSSNRYYVVKADGRHKGYASTCSKEEDMGVCCWWRYVRDTKSLPFDLTNVYQQVQIIPRRGHSFTAKAVAPDGFPPTHLRRKGWTIYAKEPKYFSLSGEARGIDTALRTRMPDFGFDISVKRSPPVVVGKWYCPFIFIKEGDEPQDQMKKSMYYEMTLEQFWEEIYACENNYGEAAGNKVEVSVSIKREMGLLNGGIAARDDNVVENEVMWFKPVVSTGSAALGLSMAIWERMRWEEERGGWVGGEKKVERVRRVEEHVEERHWNKFGCYVLVERFVLRRMNGSLALTYDFKHTDKIRAKWT